MANKKVKIPAYVLKQFDRAMYKVGDEVVIRWLGQKKIGHVTKYQKRPFGISYTVEVKEKNPISKRTSSRYPCGIQIKEYCTAYNTGLILHETTQEYYKTRTIDADTRSTTAKVKTNNRSNGVDGSSNNTKATRSRNTVTSKASTKSSAKRVRKDNSKARSLDQAIDRQKDFLNGFVKK